MTKLKAQITGVGETPYTRGTDRSERDQILDASLEACRDAGIEPSAIDGVVMAWKDSPTNEDIVNSFAHQGPQIPLACSYWRGISSSGGSTSSYGRYVRCSFESPRDHRLECIFDTGST